MTQRRYEGPSIVYLGNGWALTARHVGHGEILLDGRIYEPDSGRRHTLLNENGTAADAMVFALEPDPPPPDWPLLPIAEEPVQPGEEVLLIGFGRGRQRVAAIELDGVERFAFEWSARGEKRWGTNRVTSAYERTSQSAFSTRSFSFVFDPAHSPEATVHEAQAAVGDSGGGVFVRRDGEWQLAGLMISVATDSRAPGASSSYGDRTYVADLTHYREEILRWTRPACSNERDDDGDERVDYPLDPGCDSPRDRSERDAGDPGSRVPWLSLTATAFAVLIAGAAIAYERSRARSAS